jgi:hypothetical protein
MILVNTPLLDGNEKKPGPSTLSKQRAAVRYRVPLGDGQRPMTVWYPHGMLDVPAAICLGLCDFGRLLPQANAAFAHLTVKYRQPIQCLCHRLSLA